MAKLPAGTKKDDGAKDKLKRDKLKVTLASLVGLTYAKMSKAQQEAFITALGQVADLMDDAGKVKPLG